MSVDGWMAGAAMGRAGAGPLASMDGLSRRRAAAAGDRTQAIADMRRALTA